MNCLHAIYWERKVGDYKRLFIWVEGTDDERFFNTIVVPRLSNRYDHVQVRHYADMKNESINKFLSSIQAMGADYTFIADIDTAPCVTRKKEALQNAINRLDARRTIIVKAEIESWYHAGLDATAARRLDTRSLHDTQTLTKEQFRAMQPAWFRSGIDYMIEVLSHYDIQVARQQNRSFDYFVGKYGL